MTEEIEVKFQIIKINFRSPGTMDVIAKAKIIEQTPINSITQREVSVKGKFCTIFQNDIFKGKAKVDYDKIYGPTLTLTTVPEYMIPENINALAKFISNKVKGLSYKKALDFTTGLGLKTIDKIKEDYTCLFLYKINDKKAKYIQEELINILSFERLAIFIQSQGFPLYYATKIYEKYGENSLQLIKKNPYQLCNIDNIPFSVADSLAVTLNWNYDDDERIIASFYKYLIYKTMSGNVCILESKFTSELNKFLKKEGSYKNSKNIKHNIIYNLLESEIKKKNICREKDTLHNKYLYLPYYLNKENKIVKKLKELLNEFKSPFTDSFNIDIFLDEWEDKYGKIDDLQKEAVYNTLLHNMSILTGAPGTGKTFTLNLIVKCIQEVRKNATITLMAPTGKASERIIELTSLKATTIHRGLKIRPFSFDADSLIEEVNTDFLIIDESSMIDISLFETVISHLNSKTRVLLVGDIEQLPSVGPGLILKDLIDCKLIPTVRLSTIFRQGKDSDIILNAHAIINGLDTKTEKGFNLNTDKSKSDFFFENESDMKNIKEKILKIITNLISTKGYNLQDICILAPMKKGVLGTIELNLLLQSVLNPPKSSLCEYDLSECLTFREGDKVMQTKNNYDLKVFNGYLGEITSIYTDISKKGVEEFFIEVYYETQDKKVIYSEKDIFELDLAYAMTIHKSQGSEFKCVILPVHMSQKVMLTRNLIYTGITRAKKQLWICGESESIDYAINHIDNLNRCSRLKDKLIKEIAA